MTKEFIKRMISRCENIHDEKERKSSVEYWKKELEKINEKEGKE